MKNKEHKTTQKERNIIETYFFYWKKYGARELCDVYGRFSKKKADSFKKIRKQCEAVKGEKLTVCSHSPNFYTCGYTYTENGREYLAYFTHKNAYKIAL